MEPRGTLLIIGGAEDKGDEEEIIDVQKHFERYEILKHLVSVAKNKKIEIITTGSTVPKQVVKAYKRAFQKIGFKTPQFMQIQNKMEVRNKEYINRIAKADVVFFSGGDQFRLISILGGTKLIDTVRERYRDDENFIVAGTSAGAMFLSSTTILEGGKEEALIDSDIKLISGIGILKNCIIDTHFIKRGRFGRLAHAVTMNPDHLGIGLGENAALLITAGSKARCSGSGMVVIIDGKHIKETNVSTAPQGEPIYVENLKVHLLVKPCHFSLKSRRLYLPVKRNHPLKQNTKVHKKRNRK